MQSFPTENCHPERSEGSPAVGYMGQAGDPSLRSG
jgi:hypothetical protein